MRTALFLIACSIAFAQEFEVASIKSAGAPAPNGMVLIGPARGGPGSGDPTHITWNSATLFQILQTAYDVKNYQIEGPDWLRSERYDFAVGIPEGATKEQVAMMWRNLLASRFGMTVHKIQKEFPADELVLGPRGHKLTENNEPILEPGDPNAKPPTLPPPPPPGGEFKPPVLNGPGLFIMMRMGPTGMTAQAMGRGQPISALVTMLSNESGHPVVDKTSLTGRYDFGLEFTPTAGARLGGLAALPPPPAAPQAGPAPPTTELGLDLAGAVQQQLGLRLVKGKGMLDVIVVDKADKVPTEN